MTNHDPFEAALANQDEDKEGMESKEIVSEPASSASESASPQASSSTSDIGVTNSIVTMLQDQLNDANTKVESMTRALEIIVVELERSESQMSLSRTKIALGVAKAMLES